MFLPLYTPSPWHDMQGTATCAPVSGKPVFTWLNRARGQAAVEWHWLQSVGNPPAWWFGFCAV